MIEAGGVGGSHDPAELRAGALRGPQCRRCLPGKGGPWRVGVLRRSGRRAAPNRHPGSWHSKETEEQDRGCDRGDGPLR
ncbi:hypothetical protein NDU88_003546 [Pleurodeles waltl]|uniref:Uncharacterized protein n=1 Tax=Pleurodeles waltl TaxID=8319 RepID=A0AAV7TQX4_PLEWA|nr:hypothetical protein NDU88_003546 [Pleurodeles waltl]